MRKFAENDGKNVIEVIDRMNFKGIQDYFDNTTYFERYFYRISVRENLKESKELNHGSV